MSGWDIGDGSRVLLASGVFSNVFAPVNLLAAYHYYQHGDMGVRLELPSWSPFWFSVTSALTLHRSCRLIRFELDLGPYWS